MDEVTHSLLTVMESIHIVFSIVILVMEVLSFYKFSVHNFTYGQDKKKNWCWTKVLIGSDQGKLRKVLDNFTWLFDIYIMQIQNVMCRQYCIFLILLENLIPWFPHFVWNGENIKLWTWNFILLSYSSQLSRGKKEQDF